MDIVDQIKGAVADHENTIAQRVDIVGERVGLTTGGQSTAQAGRRIS